MNETKLNVVVPKDYNGTPIEVVLREGAAPKMLDPKEPETIDIHGTIDSPLRWLEKRVELIDQKACHIIVDRNNMEIQLVINETDYPVTLRYMRKKRLWKTWRTIVWR